MPNKSLKKYNDKREFKRTPEPQGGMPENDLLRFVVQKHNASRLHYDFRLELNGVLKSWAVPKGISLDPSVKRLAMEVEDHPFNYKNFEGIIPEGNYGAGTVIIWDEGTYEPAEESESLSKKAKEKLILSGLKQGNLKFRLSGEKLRGEFALVKTRNGHMADNAWLLIKHRDASISSKDVTKLTKSVVSGKTIEQVAKEGTSEYEREEQGPKSDIPKKNKRAIKNAGDKILKKAASNRLLNGRQSQDLEEDILFKLLTTLPVTKMPVEMEPMLATLIDKAFDDEDWNFEIKWDGFRAIAFVKAENKDRKKSQVHIQSRNQKSFDEKFYPIKKELEKLSHSMILDGEIVVVDDKGLPRFGALQNWTSLSEGTLLMYVFDILWFEGKDLRGLSVMQRQQLLKIVLDESVLNCVKIGYSTQGNGKEFLKTVAQLGLEGIIAKRRDSIYESGHRSKSWLKVKVELRQEVIILGFTNKKNSSKAFSALILGVYEKSKLRYVGKVGTGFSDKEQALLIKKFKPLIRKTNPISDQNKFKKGSNFLWEAGDTAISWLKPVLVGEVSFREQTNDGLFRHPSFKGLREDKDPRMVTLEERKETKEVLKSSKETSSSQQMNSKSTGVENGKSDTHMDSENVHTATKGKSLPDLKRNNILNANNNKQVKIGGHVVDFTNLNKMYWPKDNIAKRELIEYYYQVSAYILPYLLNRPQSLNRFPNGISGKSFYQKDITGKVPDWIKKFLYHSEGNDIDKHFLVVDNVAALLFMANLGCIEMNPWSSSIKKPDNPTWCIIDLDPAKEKKGRSFDEVIDVAKATHDVLNSLDIVGYPKTSGASGMHIYIPLNNKYDYEASKLLAKLVVTKVHELLPGLTTLERTVADRQGKMYLDFLQNRPQATIAAPYSVRPKPGATVSMPLDWSEVKSGLRKERFTLFNAIGRIKEVGDLFKPVLGPAVNLKKILRQLDQ